ncbi:MAG: hypothetical protein U0835_08215 [Isosphaeraceae bacterium]
MIRPLVTPLMLGVALTTSTIAHAQSLAAWDLSGQPGTQTSNVVTFTAAGIAGVNLTAGSGLSPNAGANSMNAAGWNDLNVNDYFQFGFTNNTGTVVAVNQILLGTRSSNTGPGLVNVSYSTNGFSTSTLLSQINQSPGSNFVNSVIDAAVNVAAGGTFLVRLTSANSTAANGGAVGSTGTFRITNYFSGGTDTGSFRITGNAITAVPEPGQIAQALAACVVLGGGYYLRRRPAAATAA